MLRKFAFLLLISALLPACASMQFPPATQGPAEVKSAEPGLFQKAEASYHRQAYRQAYQFYGEYLERYPQGAKAMEARLREAEVLGLLGDWQGSLMHYQRLLARQTEPEVSLKARYGIGRAYFKLGEYQQASQVLDNLTATDMPRSLWFSTQALLAEIALKQGRIPQAFNHLRFAAQDLSSGDQEWFDDLKTRLLDRATVAELEELVALYRDNALSAPLLLQLTRLAQKSGNADEAQKWADTLKERFPNSPEAVAAERSLAGNKVEFGCLLPLTGQLSGIGVQVQRGMEMGAKGTPVELVFRDTKASPETAASLTQELAQDASVLAILGPVSSAVAQSAAEAAQSASVPLVALSQKDGITQTGSWIFQAFLTPRQQVRALVRHARGLGIKRYAILYPDSSYGRTFAQNFEDEVTAQGGEIATKAFYSPGSQEFGPTLASLADSFTPKEEGAAGGTALFVPDDAATVAAIAGGLANTPLKGSQLLGTNLLHSAKIPEAQLTALQGVIFPDAFFARDPNPAVQKFVAAYRQRYGMDPDYLAAQGYVVLRLMVQAVEAHQATRNSLPQKLQNIKAVPALPWFRGFNAQREEDPAMYLLTVTGGGIQMVPAASGSESAQ
jgi:branched-chain amino acid transport system substrate-binding protein